MAKPRLHLDADASRKDLHAALISKGHDVTRTTAPGLALDASNEFQLLWASAHDRVLFTFNIGDSPFSQEDTRAPGHPPGQPARLFLAEINRFVGSGTYRD